MIFDVTLFPAGGIAGKQGAGPACAVRAKARPARGVRQDKQPQPASAEPEDSSSNGGAQDRCPGRFWRPVAPGLDVEGDFVLRLYLRDISNHSRVALAGGPPAAQPGTLDDSGRQQLVLGHLPRVVRIAFDYRGRGLPLGDLISEGNIGLMRAAQLFDPLRKATFACYAKPWIRVQMQRALSYQAWPVSLPADFSWRRGRVQAAQERLTAKLNRAPRDAELAEECRLDLPAVQRLRSTPPPSFVPLESPWPGSETDLTLAEAIPDETSPAPDCEATRHSDRELVDRLITVLSPAEQKVIRLRFGLDDGDHRTLEQVGKLLGYGRQGIHRLQSAALAKLRRRAHFLRADRDPERSEVRSSRCGV
ncbi:MAG: sigma-70 family RNA polymerase sigma factor [Limisphaerales bacterium]